MNIIHITEPFSGGVFDFLVTLTNNMPEFNHLIIHGLRENESNNYERFGKNTDFVYWKNATREINLKKDFLALKELVEILKNIRADVIHLHSSKAGFLGRIAAKILGLEKQVIYTPHGVAFLRKDVSYLKRNIFVLLEKFAYRLGGRIVACSESEAYEFKKHKIEASYIYNGIKCEEDFCFFNEKLKIGTIGRITVQKNPEMFNKIASYFKDIVFVWIGDGELSDKLTSSNIKITGWLSKEELKNELKNIDIYLSTSLWEGLPLSVLEAMCMKKPLILSDCVGNRDLVKNSYNGFLFSSYEEAVQVIKKIRDEDLSFYGKNSFELVNKKFSLSNMINSYKELYKKIKV